MGISPGSLEAVIFDLDGTLADTLPVVVEAFQLTFQSFDLEPLSQIEIFEHFGPTEDGVIKAMFGDFQAAAVPVFYSNYHKLLRKGVVPFAGVPDLLHSCRDRGLQRRGRGCIFRKNPGCASQTDASLSGGQSGLRYCHFLLE